MNKTITKRVTKSYSAAEKQHHLATWRTSGLNMSDYCREAGISVSSLSIWNSRDKNKPIKLQPVIRQELLPATHQETGAIEITLPGGTVIKLANPSLMSQVIPLIQEAESCN